MNVTDGKDSVYGVFNLHMRPCCWVKAYIAACQSVQVISSPRNTCLGAAATTTACNTLRKTILLVHVCSRSTDEAMAHGPRRILRQEKVICCGTVSMITHELTVEACKQV